MRKRSCMLSLIAATLFPGAAVAGAEKQVTPPPKPGTKTVQVVPGERYQGGSFRRFILGDTYRDLWAAPITVPVLDLGAFAGGLKPTEKGGGKQTKNLRFKNEAGYEFVFRLVDKENVNPPKGWEKTIVEWIARDQISAHHPAGAVVADRFLEAAGVLHPSPTLVVMPDDSLLGKYREEFAGHLGIIEPYPNVPDNARGFGDAIEVIDSDSLVVLINRDPRQQIDARAYMTDRLIDMFLNDWDRHEGNWKWARTEPDGPWRPIPRDRDKALIAYGGFVNGLHKAVPVLVDLDSHYANMKTYIYQSNLMDRRLLSTLEQSAYDSAAVFLTQRFTDEMIDDALRAMPAEYAASIPDLAAKLKARRDKLPEQAREFYQYFMEIVDVHGTDVPEQLTVTAIDGRHVEIELRELRAGYVPPGITGATAAGMTGVGVPAVGTPAYYHRRFDRNETREIRVYLHEGDDRVEVKGDVRPVIPIRVIGGNGDNKFVDAQSAAVRSDDFKFYDEGKVDGVHYPGNVTFDRRPLVTHPHLERVLPSDQGANSSPVLRLDAPGDLGLVPGVGVQKVRYDFRTYPYSYKLKALAEYSLGVGGWRFTGTADKRQEESNLHWVANARMSELEVLNFYGFGNDTPAPQNEAFYEVKQQQWSFYPAVAYSIGTRTDLMFGPIVKYATVDSTGNYLSGVQPYGFGDFGQAGVRVGVFGDSRDHTNNPGRKILLDVSASYYPKVWDVKSDFTVLSAITATYIAIPRVPLVHPILALKAGGRKVYGDFPFHEAAFIGGRPTERDIPRERYAGDSSLYGTAELRVPIMKFPIVVPVDFGAYVYTDYGRVWVDSESPGGWHDTRGVGMWIGVLSPNASISVEKGEGLGGVGMQAKIGLSF
ncbi:MAG TPA: hypothetical protein VF247_04345 [Candidatus Krumholzibacteria bacterium]